MAENALGRELEKRGAAVVRVVRLPALDTNKKIGLDDYLVDQGPKAFRALLSDPDATQAPGLYDVRDAYFERPMAEKFVAENQEIFPRTDAKTWMTFREGRWSPRDTVRSPVARRIPQAANARPSDWRRRRDRKAEEGRWDGA